MSKYPVAIKKRAIALRKRGYSLNEVSEKLKIAKSTASLWLRDISLDEKAKIRLKERGLWGRYKTSIRWKKKREEKEKVFHREALNLLKKTGTLNKHFKIYCALLFWCEGGKTMGCGLRFTNSNPLLIKTFLTLLRKSFEFDEKKLRLKLHLHEYHNENNRKKYWSQISGIPQDQFLKIFWKAHTGKRIKKDYPGCATIYYYDSDLARRLVAIYKAFAKAIEGP